MYCFCLSLGTVNYFITNNIDMFSDYYLFNCDNINNEQNITGNKY